MLNMRNIRNKSFIFNFFFMFVTCLYVLWKLLSHILLGFQILMS